MRIYSMDAYNEKKSGIGHFYVYSAVAGVFIFFVLLLLGKSISWIFKLAFSHWMYLIGIFILLVGIKKFFGKKHVVMHRANEEDRNSYP